MLIGFDSIRERSQGGISQYLLPTCKIKLGLRTQVRQLDRDRHGRRYFQENEKMKNRIGQALAIAIGIVLAHAVRPRQAYESTVPTVFR